PPGAFLQSSALRHRFPRPSLSAPHGQDCPSDPTTRAMSDRLMTMARHPERWRLDLPGSYSSYVLLHDTSISTGPTGASGTMTASHNRQRPTPSEPQTSLG